LIAKPNDKDAQNAITHYESVKTNGNATLLKLSPITGRMHQLRAHLSHIGHPILGDNKYGGLLFANNKSIKRLMLHALTLQIKLPEGSEIEHKTTLPEDFSNLME